MNPPEGRIIHAKKISSVQPKASVLRVLAQFCYNYPQYTLAEARKLPFKHVRLMLKEARREQARHYLQLTQISVAPHTKKGAGVKSLVDKYKKEANS